MLLSIVAITSATEFNCTLESWEILESNKNCKCLVDQHNYMRAELEFKENELSESNKELKLLTNEMKAFRNEFLIFTCEDDAENPSLCVVRNIKVPNEIIKVIKVLIHEDSYMEVEDITELEILDSETTFIPRQLFSILPNLEFLTIITSSLTIITKGSFKGADKIESITIEGNIIHDLGPNIFEGAETVRQLLLTENEITTISPKTFNGLNNLDVLSLRGNRVVVLDENIFKDNILLRKLIISHNKIEKVHDNLIRYNTELTTLKLDSVTKISSNVTKYAKKKVAIVTGDTIEIEVPDEIVKDGVDERVQKSLDEDGGAVKL
ncbi:unnamed protein product [Diamesa serratosioi]